MDKELTILGYVRSTITDVHTAPKMENEKGAVRVRLELDASFAEGLDTLEPGSTLDIFTWLHKGKRDVLKVHPRGDTSQPMRGVFTTRSPARPNPIGVHRVTVIAIEEPATLVVEPMEVIDGTPVIDIKPLPK